jgi:hypothetical protein
MPIKQFEVWIADLNQQIGTEPGKENCKITYYFHSEPTQNIPSWLINPRIHEMPYKTLSALREIVNDYK